MRDATRDDHADRIARATAHLWANLDAPLNYEQLAGIACLSPYHFHRVYRAALGETPDQTLRRLRLHRAAGALLAQDPAPLERIARRAGYASPEAFSRAFAASYGAPPARWRAARLPQTRPPGPKEITDMHDVAIERFPGATLIGKPHRGDYMKIGEAFQQVYAWAGAQGLLGPETRGVGIYHDDPAATPEADLRAFAGLMIDADIALPDGFERVSIPECETAKLVYKGPYADLPRAYDDLYGRWLPQSGRSPGDAPCFEEYLNDPTETPASALLTAIRMPLAG